SRMVLALRTWICNPMAPAAACTSLNVVSVVVALAGLTSTAIRAAPGTISRRNSSRFAVNSPLKRLIPVRLPPGRARLANTEFDRIPGNVEHNWNRGRSLDRDSGRDGACDDHRHRTAHQLVLTLDPTVFNRDILALDIARCP